MRDELVVVSGNDLVDDHELLDILLLRGQTVIQGIIFKVFLFGLETQLLESPVAEARKKKRSS